jgi:hypothetical protein
MEQLLAQAQQLVADLRAKLKDVNDQKAKLDKKANEQITVQATLDQFQAELLEREAHVKTIENAEKIIDEANKQKAIVDLDRNGIDDRLEALKAEEQRVKSELAAERAELQQKRELYERGAKENAITKQKLDEKLKKLKEVTV